MSISAALWEHSLQTIRCTPWRGRVIKANGQWLEAAGPPSSIGEICEVRSAQGRHWLGEVVGFHQQRIVVMLFEPADVRHGDEVVGTGEQASIGVGAALLGRVVNAHGTAIDGEGSIATSRRVPLREPLPSPFDRTPIDTIFVTGIRAVDGMLSIGEGQRVGIFGGSGVGKSTIISMLARGCRDRICVIGLVGERGREVVEMTEKTLGAAGLRNSVLVVATSDQSPLVKMLAAESATRIAEYFQQQGQNVLLIIDSLTRYAMAAREVGLANGEPPTSKGYTPSVFSKLARLVERAGKFSAGSITAIYTVLMEGDDQEDPIVDAARSFLDGHFVLSRELAMSGWYPPLDIPSSVSRLMSSIVSDRHLDDASQVLQSMAVFAKSEDLVRIGAYKKGADPELDRAITMRPSIRAFLQQKPTEVAEFHETLDQLKLVSH